MRRHNPLAERSTFEWVVRILIAMVLLFIGYIAVIYTVAQTTARVDPEEAHQLAPFDGRIEARLATVLFTDAADAEQRARAVHLARVALQDEPTAVAAATTLGFQAQIEGDIPKTRRYFAYAQELSRRDLPTQLWAIEDAVSRGDVAGAIHNYDIALRTSRMAPDILFPILATAIDDAQVRSRVAMTLLAQPSWGPNFLTYASVHADPRTAARLFGGLGRAGMPVSSTATSAVVDRLIAIGAVDDAWRYYASVRKGA